MAIIALPTSVTAFVGRARRGPFDRPVPIRSVAAFERTFGRLVTDDTLRTAVVQYFANGGRDAVICRARTLGDDGGAQERRGEGLWALDRIDGFNLLCVPPPSFADDADIGPALRALATRVCERRGAIYLADPPAAWRVGADAAAAGAGAAAGGHPSANAATYFPRLRPAPGEDGIAPTIGSSGAVAGIIARLDVAQGVWKAPAGAAATLTGVASLVPHLDEDDIARLAPLGINPIRPLPSVGLVVWGARTCRGADALGSEWKYLPVRRFALHVEQCLRHGLAWTADEPSDETLWAVVRGQTDDFLHGYFRQGALQGTTPRDAWFVRCDRSTMTEADLAAGRLVALVGIAPTRPAEFVVLSVVLRARQA